MRKLNVITHSGKFHADDVFAVAVVSLYLEKSGHKMKVTRTTDPLLIKKADFVLDVGRIYNSKNNRFDHHQAQTAGKRSNGILYAAFGLVWKKFGPIISKSKKATEIVDQKLVAPLDAGDNAISIYESIIPEIKPVGIDNYIWIEAAAILDRKYKDQEKLNSALDSKFNELVELARNIIEKYVLKAQTIIASRVIAEKVYKKAKDKRLIIMDKHASFNFAEFPKPLMVVFLDSRGQWAAQAVKQKNEDIKCRIYFPKNWRGKVDNELAKVTGVKDARFCHNSGYLAVARSKEGAISLAKIAIKKITKS